MAPPKLNLFKYGMPLYGAAWPSRDIIFVVGGGGHGIKNRLVFARYRDGVLSDQIGEFNFGEECPTRLAVSPDGRHLLVAIGSGGLKAFELDGSPGLCPNVVPVTGSQAAALAAVAGEVKVLQFNGEGDLLAVGCEDGSLSVLSWPGVEEQFSLRGESKLKDAVRDIDFSPAHGDAVAALVCQNGTCEVWELREKRCLCKLQMQKELERPSFSKCRWSRDGTSLLYTLVNNPQGAHVAVWDVGAEGPGVMKLRQHAMLTKEAGTAFGISPNGALLALGTAEGGVVVCSTKLRPVRKANKVHMVFTTDLAFSEASDAVLSVSADAGAHVLEVAPGGRKKQQQQQRGGQGGCCSTLFQLLLVSLFLLGLLACGLYLLEQPAVRDLLPPTALTHVDRVRGHVYHGIAQGQEWWESEQAQQLRDSAREKLDELVERAKELAQQAQPLVNKLLHRASGQRVVGSSSGAAGVADAPQVVEDVAAQETFYEED